MLHHPQEGASHQNFLIGVAALGLLSVLALLGRLDGPGLRTFLPISITAALALSALLHGMLSYCRNEFPADLEGEAMAETARLPTMVG